MSDSSGNAVFRGIDLRSGSALNWRRNRRHDGMISELPVAESHVAQLSAGDSFFQSRRHVGRDLLLVKVYSAPHIAAYLVPAKGWLGLWSPLSWEGDYVRNGQEGEPGSFFLSGHRHGYSVREKRCLHFVLAIRCRHIESIVTKLTARPCAPLEKYEGRLRLSPDRGRIFQRQILATVAKAGGRVTTEGTHFLTEGQEASLSLLAARLFLESGMEEKPLRYVGLTDRMIVRAVLEGLHQHEGPPNLAELCAAARVGSTRLHEAFQSLYGVPPMRFVRYLRLQMARNRLADPERPPRSVKEVSTQLAFDHGGRFARDYAALFAERPSETLEETRLRAGVILPPDSS